MAENPFIFIEGSVWPLVKLNLVVKECRQNTYDFCMHILDFIANAQFILTPDWS